MLLRTRPYLVMYYSIDTSIGMYYTFIEDIEVHTFKIMNWPQELALAPWYSWVWYAVMNEKKFAKKVVFIACLLTEYLFCQHCKK